MENTSNDNQNKGGRPATTDEQFQKWLDDMTPFLKLGETLNAAMEDAELLSSHETVIREKYRLGDWFARKIDAYRAYPGKLANNVIVKVVIQANEKIKQGLPVSEDEMKNVRFFAEKSRSAQPYFVNRQETAQAKPIEDLLDELDEKGDTINDVTTEIKKQVVEANPPVQNQEQAGDNGVVPTQPDATQTPA